MIVSRIRASVRAAVVPFALLGGVLVAHPGTVAAAGDGCSGTAITSVSQLQNIGVSASLPLTGVYCLTQNLNAAATAGWNAHAGFLPIAGNDYLRLDRGFSGIFDGEGHTISNLTIINTKTYGTGLFAVLQGTVRNLRLTNVHITGPYDVGGLAGDLIGGTIDASSVTGAITATKANGDSVGGVAGYVSQGTIANSFATARVVIPANTWGGGLAGYNIGGGITQSYSTGAVQGPSGSVRGGFLGQDDGATSGDFWDITTSHLAAGAGRRLCICTAATGISDAQMKQQSTFTHAGWNLSTVWLVKNTYPALRTPTAPPPATVIHIKAALTAPTVARAASESLTVTTTPGAHILLQVQYPETGGFKKRGTADTQGVWQHTWTVNAANAGTGMVTLTVTAGGATRHFSKQFQIT